MSEFKPSRPDVDLLAARANELRAGLRQRDPKNLAAQTGTAFNGAGFDFDFWGEEVEFSFPELRVTNKAKEFELPGFHQAMILYYFTHCTGAPLAGEWISFADLPDGRMYNQAFQGYSGHELARKFGLDVTAFCRAAEDAGGIREELGDAAYRFQALPRVPLLVVYWQGDEDFPSSCQILFDASASQCLPTDACAILGSMLKSKIVQSAK